MIVCSCNLITAKDVDDAVDALRTADPFVVLTPGLIYRHLGKRPSCGSCLPLVSKLMVIHDEEGLSASGPGARRGVEEP
jgi:bacterioferritin-associated ferredoxin